MPTNKIFRYLTSITNSYNYSKISSGAQVLRDTRLNRLELLAELIPDSVFQSSSFRALHQLRSFKDVAGTHELPVGLLACCDTAMNQCAGAHFCRACDQLLDDPANGSDKDVVIAYQF